MAKRTVEESSLTAVADAIRERAGTSEPLVFPEGFKSAVEGIPDLLEALITSTLTEYSNDKLTNVKAFTFTETRALQKISVPNLTKIPWYCFDGCSSLVEVNADSATSVAFCGLSRTKVDYIKLPSLKQIDGGSFTGSPISTLILPGATMCTLENVNAFSSTNISNGTGFIYVPKSLENSYKSASNWSNFSSQIRAIEDYPEITGGAV